MIVHSRLLLRSSLIRAGLPSAGHCRIVGLSPYAAVPLSSTYPRSRTSAVSYHTSPHPASSPHQATNTKIEEDQAYYGRISPRTAYAGQLSVADVGREVVLAGWLASARRGSASMSFYTLRDSSGMVQLVIVDTTKSPPTDSELLSVPIESVVQIHGTVRARPDKDARSLSSEVPGGLVEVNVTSWEVLNPAARQLPFYPYNERLMPRSEEARVSNRHLDLRRRSLTENLQLRSRVAHRVRNYLFDKAFTEVETPLLLRSTPEGAREFLVPTRTPVIQKVNEEVPKGSDALAVHRITHVPTFYALPQSPQQPKQILMASGVTDKYYQFAKCFRDEDNRKDRQPEFTQIDLEMAFANGRPEAGDTSGWNIGGSEVRRAAEGLIREVWKEAKGVDVLPTSDGTGNTGFKVIEYAEAMSRYGVDKPDARFCLEIVDLAAGLKPYDLSGEEEKGNEDDARMMKEKAGILEILIFRTPKKDQPLTREDALRITKANSGGPGTLERFKCAQPAPQAIAQLLLSRSALVRSYLFDIGLPHNQVDVQVFAQQVELALQKGRFHLEGHQGATMESDPGEEVQVWMQRRKTPTSGDSTELGDLRLRLRDLVVERGWTKLPDELKFLWVTEFPLLTRIEKGEAESPVGRWVSTHHPFTAPMHSDLPVLKRLLSRVATSPTSLGLYENRLRKMRGQHYDLVLNGVEIGGGSVRIHSPWLQKEIFERIHQLSPQEIGTFGPLLKALQSGCPPHAGMAIGFDRLISLLTKVECASIRDVIAFPKIGETSKDPFFQSPSPIGGPVARKRPRRIVVDGPVKVSKSKWKKTLAQKEAKARRAANLRNLWPGTRQDSNPTAMTQGEWKRAQGEEQMAMEDDDDEDDDDDESSLDEEDEDDDEDEEDEEEDEEDEDEEDEEEDDEDGEEQAVSTATTTTRSTSAAESASNSSMLTSEEQAAKESLLLTTYGLHRMSVQMQDEFIFIPPRFKKVSRAKVRRQRREEAKAKTLQEHLEWERRRAERGF